jgi:hypothetical protein
MTDGELNMKTKTRLLLALVVVTTVYSCLASGQTSDRSEEAIRAILDTGFIDGHYLKEIGPMGDAAAVAVTRIMAGRTLTSADIDNVLVVLGSAFADPSMVQNVSDRQPRTALFVLQCLASSTNDLEQKKRIAQRRQYVTDQYTKSMHGLPQK